MVQVKLRTNSSKNCICRVAGEPCSAAAAPPSVAPSAIRPSISDTWRCSGWCRSKIRRSPGSGSGRVRTVSDRALGHSRLAYRTSQYKIAKQHNKRSSTIGSVFRARVGVSYKQTHAVFVCAALRWVRDSNLICMCPQFPYESARGHIKSHWHVRYHTQREHMRTRRAERRRRVVAPARLRICRPSSLVTTMMMNATTCWSSPWPAYLQTLACRSNLDRQLPCLVLTFTCTHAVWMWSDAACKTNRRIRGANKSYERRTRLRH